MKSLSFALFSTLFLCVGCFDIFSEDQKELIGNISVINPNNQEDKGYKLVIYEDEINKNVIDGYIIDVNGNDSTLLVKSIGKRECDEHYYKIKHRKGQMIVHTAEIDINNYSSLLQKINSKINFHADRSHCP